MAKHPLNTANWIAAYMNNANEAKGRSATTTTSTASPLQILAAADRRFIRIRTPTPPRTRCQFRSESSDLAMVNGGTSRQHLPPTQGLSRADQSCQSMTRRTSSTLTVSSVLTSRSENDLCPTSLRADSSGLGGSRATLHGKTPKSRASSASTNGQTTTAAGRRSTRCSSRVTRCQDL